MFAYSQNPNQTQETNITENGMINRINTIKYCIYKNIIDNIINNKPEELNSTIQNMKCKHLCNDVV